MTNMPPRIPNRPVRTAAEIRCGNAQPGAYGHECGAPATWIGTFPTKNTIDGKFYSGCCSRCKTHGHESRGAIKWERMTPESTIQDLWR